MAVTNWLIDKSAYVRLQLGQTANRDEWSSRISRGLVRLCTITRLELGYAARSGEIGRRQFAAPPLSLMPVEHLTPAIEERALEVQLLLADRGRHRAPSIPDLLIAATAEKTGLTVLAVDKDFDLIAAITGQPIENLPSSPAGSSRRRRPGTAIRSDATSGGLRRRESQPRS